MNQKAKTIKVKIKYNGHVAEYTENNVKFYSFEKDYLEILFENRKRAYYRLSTVLNVREI